jgi:cytochrome c-type biogenesis protein
LIGALSALLGRLAGEVSPYWTILVAALLFWVGLDMMGLASLPLSGALLSRFKLKGLAGALVLGLAYGLLSGACTLGFLAPVMALAATQESWLHSLTLVLLFGLGHCLPIALAGSSTALVQRLVNSGSHRQSSLWFRRCSGVLVMALGLYLALSPFLGES